MRPHFYQLISMSFLNFNLVVITHTQLGSDPHFGIADLQNK